MDDDNLMLTDLLGSFNFDDDEYDLEMVSVPLGISDVLSPIQSICNSLKCYKNLLKIGHLNARSIPGSIDELRRIMLECKFDIFGVSESWLSKGVPEDRYKINGYNIYRKDRADKKCGGVCFYVREDIKCKCINIQYDYEQPEMLWIEVVVSNVKIALCCVYKQPKIPYTVFYNIQSIILEMQNLYSDVVLTGDFNVDMLNSSQYNVKFFNDNIIKPCSLVQVINEPTRVTETSSTLLDLFLVCNQDVVKVAGATVLPGISDHSLIYIAYSVKKPHFKPKFIKKRDYTFFSEQEYMRDSDVAPWENVYMVEDINDKVLIFENIINDLFNKHAPMKMFRVTHPPAPWLTDDIKNVMDNRDRYKIKYNISDKNDKIALDRYKSLKNTVTSMVRKSKINCFNNFINNKTKNTKEFWKSLKFFDVVGSERNTHSCVCSPSSLNEAFLQNNNAPVNMALISEQIDTVLQQQLYPSFEFEHVQEAEVAKIIKSITTNAVGVDGINARQLKLSMPNCVSVITHLINYSFSTCEFPDKWKYAIVKPLPKAHSAALPTDYRPISLLPTVSKVLEKIVSVQVLKYLKNHELMDPLQSGFKESHSTLSALLKVTNDIFDALDNSEVSILVLLDYSKAFDTINHQLLLAKMQALGFKYSALDWFSSYLSNRFQTVVVEDEKSSWQSVANGVPQGSVLGPLLFSILVSDLRHCIQCSRYHMYADDTQLYLHTSVTNLPRAFDMINHDINEVKGYSEHNGIKLNASKSVYMIVGSHRNLSKIAAMQLPNIIIDNTIINRSPHVKNLGLTFDEVLSWQKHINICIAKAYNKLKHIYRFKKILSRDSKKMLCEALVLSQFDYADVVYSNISSSLSNAIQKVQNSCLRYIFNIKKKDHIRLSPLLKKLKWLNMENRRLLHCYTVVFKILSGKAPSYLSCELQTAAEQHSYNTRSRYNLYPINRRTMMRNRSFMVRVPSLYNQLPQEIRSVSSVLSFKKYCAKFLLSSQV